MVYYKGDKFRESFMDAIEASYKRRSVRKYLDKPVEKEKIETLLKAAMAAPSARNVQEWHFYVVQGKEKMQGLIDIMPYGKYNAPCAIVVCGDLDNSLKETAQKYWVQDCTAALENILNAAPELGLGTVWLGVYPNDDREEPTIEFLGLPETKIPLGVVYVGYPGEEKEPRTQYDESKVTYF
jgi:nitroreductase